MTNDGPILLFDGVCHVCDALVRFILDHEASPALRFAPLQSDVAKELLVAHGMAAAAGDPDTVVLVDRGRAFVRSSAVLRVVGLLRWPYRALGVLLLLPRPIRDFLYRAFARRRYAWFGRKEVCMVPTPELRARFLG